MVNRHGADLSVRPTLRRIRQVAVCAALGLLAAACGGDDDASNDDAAADVTSTAAPGTEPSGATSVAPDSSTPGETTAATTAPAATPTAGGELVVGSIFDAFGLEPTTFVGGVTDGPIGFALYDSLMRLTADGVPEPFLAERVETSDDQTYTVTLQSGVVFHDGTPLDAEAVKANLERHMDPATKSRALNNAQNIQAVTVLDPLTVEIALKFPWVAFREVMAGPLGLIASPTAIAAGTINTSPVGSGPFKFEERVPGDHTTLVKNENYWREGEPYLDRITFRVILDDDVRQTSVQEGEIDAAQSIRGDTLAAADDTDGVKATQTPGHVNTIHINTSAAPVDDPRVRQALALALDYDALNQVIYDGAAPTTHHFIAEDSPYFDDSVAFPEFAAEAAAALIEEYEAENGPVEFTFRCYNEPSRVQLTELATQMWSAVGIDVTTELSDQTTLVIDLLQSNYVVACFSMGAETTDPDLMWFNSLRTGSPTNYSKYSNPELDAALDAGRSTSDEAARAEAYSTVQRILAEDNPIIQYSSSPWGFVVGDNVEGLVALPGGAFAPGPVYLAG